MKNILISVCFLLVAPLANSQDNSIEYRDLVKKGNTLYQAKDYKNSGAAFSSAFQLQGQSPSFDDRYNAACSWSLAGFPDSAFQQLNLIAGLKSLNLNDVEDIITDKDFVPIQGDKRWEDAINKLFTAAYLGFQTMQKEAGLRSFVPAPQKFLISWPKQTLVDSTFSHLNDPAKQLLREKKLPEAFKYLKFSQTSFPFRSAFNWDLGDYYLTTGDKTRAFVYYSRALDVKYYRAMANVNRLPGIDSALILDHDMISARTGIKSLPTENLVFALANQLMSKGFPDKAHEMHQRNILFHPNSFRGYKGLGDYYTAKGEKEKADEYNAKALLLQYRLPETFFQPSFDIAAYINSRYDSVSRQRGYKILTPEAMVNALANYFSGKQNFEKAETLLRMNVENYPGSQNAWNRIISLYKSMGNKSKEEEFMKKAAEAKKNPAHKSFSGNVAIADSSYNTSVQNPVCLKECPVVLIDEAHNNYHTATGRYKPFADLLANDGFQVVRGEELFSKQSLDRVRAVVIASTGFISEKEIKILNEWIRGGGSILIITDHDNHYSNDLLESLGVQTPDINYTADSLHGTFSISFDEKDKLLGFHPIISGRNNSEKVRKVISFTGRSIVGPAGSTVLLPISQSAIDYMTIDPSLRSVQDMVAVPVKGIRSHGVAFSLGKGRVVAVSEAAMLTAQLFPPDGQFVGMNVTGSDNRQFVLNIIRWLTGYLDKR